MLLIRWARFGNPVKPSTSQEQGRKRMMIAQQMVGENNGSAVSGFHRSVNAFKFYSKFLSYILTSKCRMRA